MQRAHAEYTRSWYRVNQAIKLGMNNPDGIAILNKHFNINRDDIIDYLGNLLSICKSETAVIALKDMISSNCPQSVSRDKIIKTLDNHLELFNPDV